ncbi:hypothetical protein ABZY06_33935 [Streptomyces sp. NPDC006540]|uniref:hypothetical protein n=1 Tax=Streptomyces sp. NPDC006540 TaxID=3155353 RepID=UPI0033BA3B12
MAMNNREPLWSRTDHMIADLIDSTTALRWLIANKDVPENRRRPFPDPYPRPGDKPKKHVVTAEALAAFRERTRKR